MSLDQYKDASRKELWQILQIQAERTAELEQVVAAAGVVSFFVKYNEYPEMGTAEFNELTDLLNNLDVKLLALKEQGG